MSGQAAARKAMGDYDISQRRACRLAHCSAGYAKHAREGGGAIPRLSGVIGRRIIQKFAKR